VSTFIRHNLSDEDLVRESRAGSEMHFNVLVDRYTGVVYRIAFGITRSHHEAEDIVQETFLRAFKNLDRFTPERAAFKAWILTIARNQSINVFSSLKRRAFRFMGDAESEDPDGFSETASFSGSSRDAETLLAAKQEFSRLGKALEKLPERQRTALLLKTQEEMSYDAIGEVMKCSASSVESLIFRARKKLMELMEK
jgi:RNA polymerase sigma-70 factor, ECF subfamily